MESTGKLTYVYENGSSPVGLEPGRQRVRISAQFAGHHACKVFGSTIWSLRSHALMAFLASIVLLSICLIGTPSRRCSRGIFASDPTLITPGPACLKSKQETLIKGSNLYEKLSSKGSISSANQQLARLLTLFGNLQYPQGLQ